VRAMAGEVLGFPGRSRSRELRLALSPNSCRPCPSCAQPRSALSRLSARSARPACFERSRSGFGLDSRENREEAV
jgi:hypothetical protein